MKTDYFKGHPGWTESYSPVGVGALAGELERMTREASIIGAGLRQSAQAEPD